MMRIFFTVTMLVCSLAALIAQQPTLRGKGTYQHSREFLQYDKADCFEITRNEADRAFRLRYWDDAMSLYRAAKACADADQNGRADMSKRIVACRDSARQELLNEQEKAIRQARHATAEKLAGLSQSELRNYDRTLAYRLADFAQTYVVPTGDDNAAVLQALYDAAHFVPAVHAGLRDFPHLHMPFTYQIADNFSEACRIAIAGKGAEQVIYGLLPEQSKLRIWDAQTYASKGEWKIDSTANDLIVAPNNKMLAIRTASGYQLRSSFRTFSHTVSEPGMAQFDESGQYFFYVNRGSGVLQTLDARGIFDQYQRNTTSKGERKQSNRSTQSAPPPNVLIEGIRLDLVGLRVWHNQVWLIYPHSVEHWVDNALARTYLFKDAIQQAQVYPAAQQLLTMQENEQICLWQLPTEGDAQRKQTWNGIWLGGNPDGSLIAHVLENSKNPDNANLYIRTTNSDSLVAAVLVDNNLLQFPKTASLSEDSRLLAAITLNGELLAWRIVPDTIAINKPLGSFSTLNSDASIAYWWEEGSLWNQELPNGTPKQLAAQVHKPFYETLYATNTWVGFFIGLDSLFLLNKAQPTRPYMLRTDVISNHFAISHDEKWIAYVTPEGQLTVASLQRPEAPIFQRDFAGGSFNFLRGNGPMELVVLEATDETGSKPFVWTPATNKSGQVARLDNRSDVRYAAVSPSGKWIAFGDETDVRVFLSDNLLDERLRFNKIDIRLSALAFGADDRTILAGYQDGTITAWDTESGDARFSLVNSTDASNQWIEQVAYRAADRTLVTLSDKGLVQEHTLSPNAIKKELQTASRQLLSFSNDEVHAYGLDEVLDYPNNFQVLASSGDLPLIRTFIYYFQYEADQSNNTERVKDYVTRAFSLYSKLDKDARHLLQHSMLDMYEGYAWKLLTRKRTAEVRDLTTHIQRHFGNVPLTTLLQADVALLSGEWSQAATHYATWMMRAQDPYTDLDAEKLWKRFAELHQYELLTPTHRAAVCAVMEAFPNTRASFCPDQPMDMPIQKLLPDPILRSRWQIFHTLQAAQEAPWQQQKTALTYAALEQARILATQQPAQKVLAERAALRYADAAYFQYLFEKTGSKSFQVLRETIRVLWLDTPYQEEESTRQEALFTAYLNLTNALLDADSLAAAERTINATLNLIGPNPNSEITIDQASEMWLAKSELYLLNGKPDDALAAVEEAEALSPEVNGAEYSAIAHLLKGTPYQPWLDFGKAIETQEDLVNTLALMDRVANKLGRDSLRAASQQLLHFFTKPEKGIDSVATMALFYDARKMQSEASGHWAATYQYAAAKTQLIRNYPDRNKTMPLDYVEALIAESYFGLLVPTIAPDSIIALCQYTLSYIEKEKLSYAFSHYVYSNLGHAYLVRQQPGDTERALKAYQKFMEAPNASYPNDSILDKDFRLLTEAGVRLPNLADIRTRLALPPASQ